ncbi:hypothetical protein BRD13_06065 [Halobacteriales archaeon SW_5_70_135]|nr:MAG: hypothetical protein BRD13_06065 [Halobacteriales archaeon SW_5_70_135]
MSSSVSSRSSLTSVSGWNDPLQVGNGRCPCGVVGLADPLCDLLGEQVPPVVQRREVVRDEQTVRDVRHPRGVVQLRGVVGGVVAGLGRSSHAAGRREDAHARGGTGEKRPSRLHATATYRRRNKNPRIVACAGAGARRRRADDASPRFRCERGGAGASRDAADRRGVTSAGRRAGYSPVG